MPLLYIILYRPFQIDKKWSPFSKWWPKVTKFEVLTKRKILQALFINYLQDFIVPRPGIEPGWVAPLVFETSASTDSAIWAFVFLKCDAKVRHFFISAKLFELFLKKLFIYLSIPLKSSTFARRLLSTHEKWVVVDTSGLRVINLINLANWLIITRGGFP